MKRSLLRICVALLQCSFLILFVSCKLGNTKSKTLGDDPATPDPQALGYITKLDNRCGNSNCHGDAASQITYTTLTRFANQTRSYHQCLEQKECFGDLDKPKALACWDCITGAGGLRAQGGLYHAAIWKGTVRNIIEKAELNFSDLSIHMLRMPPRDPTIERDLGVNTNEFREMATWFTNEANTDFARIRTVRLPDDEGGANLQNVTCNSFSPIVERQVIEDFSMEGISMYGCRGTGWPEDPKTCLTQVPDSEFADTSTPGVVVKVLRKLVGRPSSAFWMRSSADGRYSSIGNGIIEDLKIADRQINVEDGSIDPAFSPDNKFYLWPDMICPIGPLSDTTLTSVGTRIAASGCVAEGVGVYGSLGTDPSGDILLISGYTNNNFGGGGQTTDASDMPGEDGSFNIRRISNNKITADYKSFTTPYETDYQIAPSGKIVVGRLLSRGNGQVFRVRTVKPDGTTINPIDNNATGIICMKGEKANISFDNRFVAFHHYADGSEQDKGQRDGTANIFIYDILKKRGVRVTNFKDQTNGGFFPHFRADGWLTFLIKGSDGVESVATSNAALILQELP